MTTGASATSATASTSGSTRSPTTARAPTTARSSRSRRCSGWRWGGLLGRGFGNGSPERVPYAESDFIVASIGEELGLTGVIAVVLLYGLLVERALRAALVCRDGFGKLVAIGLAGVLALQVFVVIGGVTRLIPLTGLTTPVPVVRRLEPGRQLGDHRAAAADLRPGPAPGPVADRRTTTPTPSRPRSSRRCGAHEQADPHHLRSSACCCSWR